MKYGNPSLQSSLPLFHSFYTKAHSEQTRMTAAVIASEQSHLDSVYIRPELPPAPTDSFSTSSNTVLGGSASTMETTSGYENGRIKEPHWGEETDFLFSADYLPKLSEVEHESNARVLAKMLRQKLVHRIKLLTGREPRLRSGSGHYLDPLKSDPAPPYFYEWRFTREYPGFPVRPLANWQQYQIKECNAALENGDLYLVDVRNPGPRPPPKQVVAASAGIPASVGVPTGHQNRKRLVNIAEAAFSRYIVTETGITSYDYRDVLLGDGSRGLPGWRWIFPTTGMLTKFPVINNFWNWSTDELLQALHALLMKTLRLERFDPSENQDAVARGLPETVSAATQHFVSRHPMPAEPPTNNYQHPIYIESPDPAAAQDQLAAELNAAAQPRASIAPAIHDVDDLVTKLTTRSQQWKEDWNQLQESKAREDSLRATNAAQASRIEVLEKALREIETLGSASTAAVQTSQRTKPAASIQDAINGIQIFYRGEISELKAQNEELKEVIQEQERDVQNAVWLRERNHLLEMQLAEKTAEVSSAHEALAILTGASASSEASSLSANGLANAPAQRPDRPRLLPAQPVQLIDGGTSRGIKCDKCRRGKQSCFNPGGPCARCQKVGDTCTFDMQKDPNGENGELKISEAVAKARMATELASQFLQSRQHLSPYATPSQGQSRPQAPSQQSMNSRQVSQHASMKCSSSSTPQSVNYNMKRAAADGLASVNKRPATNNSYQTPYPVDYEEHGTRAGM
ncbi:hypothetical protein DL95DRAFT_523208 [Leptodontidium sp. 2 PMI_412]|nr:hypothetical protein DL95DRAFT_523208 [Leptodontidium sp. 2 PMI_412]